MCFNSLKNLSNLNMWAELNLNQPSDQLKSILDFNNKPISSYTCTEQEVINSLEHRISHNALQLTRFIIHVTLLLHKFCMFSYFLDPD